jgi:hypothetical protein
MLTLVNRRLFAVLLLLTAALQGPLLTYAASLSATEGFVTRSCADQTQFNAKACEDCCGSDLMTSCLLQCLATGAAISVAHGIPIRVAAGSLLVPDTGIAPFAERDPPHPFRPPIV